MTIRILDPSKFIVSEPFTYRYRLGDGCADVANLHNADGKCAAEGKPEGSDVLLCRVAFF